MSFGYYAQATVWQKVLTGDTGNPFEPPTESWQRSVISCEWQQDNKTMKDDNGAEFISSTVYFTLSQVPKGSMIYQGVVADATPHQLAETVRAVDSGTSFPGDPVEYILATD